MAGEYAAHYKHLPLSHRRMVDRAVRAGVPRDIAVIIIMESARWKNVSFALGLALIQQESGYRNVFGHDPTGSIPRRWMGTKVTKMKYNYYKKRRPSLGMQGVGPAQLTWYATQDYADKLGGCHNPAANIRVAMQTLAANIRDNGYVKGVEKYNGTGPAAVRYSRTVRAAATRWQKVVG